MTETPCWLQLVFTTNSQQAEILMAYLEALGSAALTLEDAADQALFDLGPGQSTGADQEQAELWDQVRLIALFEASTDWEALIKQLRDLLPDCPPHELRMLQDEDWQHAWMMHFKALQFGENLWVCPSWETPPDAQAHNLILDPGMAFGTGTHETTALCLRWLAEHAEACRDQTVIDYGCGSGILAIAAAKLGAESVWAVDIEQQALDSSAQNARENDVFSVLQISPPQADKSIQADLLIANILANPLISLAAQFAEYSREQGQIILSGILQDQVPQVLAAYQPYYDFADSQLENGWALLVGQRRTQ